MKIANNNHPVFKASLVNKAKIGKLFNGRYANESVSFVKIDPFNHGDINTLEYCANYWANDKFALNIYYAARALRNKSKYYEGHEVYALTAQTADYEKLEKTDILGLVQVSPLEDKSMYIEHFQVDPALVNNSQPTYKGVGTAILNLLKQLNDRISCCPSFEKSVINFYIKNGFKKSPDVINYYSWQKTV